VRPARRWIIVACLCLLPVIHQAAAADQPEPPRAKLKISGYGFVGDLRLKKMLGILQEGTKQPEFYNASFLEDAALLLVSRLEDDGYLRPVIIAHVTLENGRQVSYVWDESVEDPLSRSLRAKKVHFEIREGVLYHLDRLDFDGLAALPEKRARSFFIESTGLLSLKRNRIYAPDRFKRSVANLTDELQRLGYQEVNVSVVSLKQDPRNGSVNTIIAVREGPKYIVRSVRQEVLFPGAAAPAEARTNAPNKPFSRLWEQDFSQRIKTNYFRQGYPDVAVEFKTLARETSTNEVHLDLEALVKTGPRVKVGDVAFTGRQRTRSSVLEHRVSLKEGEWLDRIEAERGRHRLSRLGIFDSVELKYDVAGEDTRNVTYALDEGKRIDVSLLFGYGSYELLRGGVQLDQYNVFGRAHHSRFRVTQSFKSSGANYTYTMPELLGEDIDVFLNGSALRREEVSFTRQEYGGGAGVRRFFRSAATDVTFRYDYQVLQTAEAELDVSQEGVKNPAVGAFIIDIRHDRRDNPLYPRRGYKVFCTFEFAREYFGGDVNYQRVDLSGSYHWPIGEAQWLHFGLSHGVVGTVGSPTNDLPFSKRFFPGGENSIRGFQEGEASPRNASDEIVGAQTYLLGNFEFEQALTPRWSLVLFTDGIGIARRLRDYPAADVLFAAGGGIRWKTFIGPVRLEYGHNLNPRPDDPSGTLHFSLGFPF